MAKSRVLLSVTLLATGLAVALPTQPVRAQAPKAATVQPERELLGIRLGRPFMDVVRAFKQPSEVQTVALANSSDQLPGLGGGGAMGAMGGAMGPGMMGGMGGSDLPGMAGPGMMGGGSAGMGGSMMGGGPGAGAAVGGMMAGSGGGGKLGAMMGGGGSGGMGPGGPGMGDYGPGGGPPTLPPGGAGMFPGADGGMGGGLGTQQGYVPEYSTAILWIYKRPNDLRYEFLINEDGRVAQISVAMPADKTKTLAANAAAPRTARGIRLGSPLETVMQTYGYPERHRMLPGLRFYELYYTKKYHAAFTMDTQKQMKLVRMTIALAD